ncbi:MAG: hypothetical protein M3R17_19065 [Bacteroidota bacterium]|nr:hypothetical protein [Bacteroidota bacterium]
MVAKLNTSHKILLFIYGAITLLLSILPFIIGIDYNDSSLGRSYSLLSYLFFPIILFAFLFRSVFQPVWRAPAFLLLFCTIGILMSFIFVFYDFNFGWSGAGNDWCFGLLFYGLYALLQYHTVRLLTNLLTGWLYGLILPIVMGMIAFLLIKLFETVLSGTGLDNGALLNERR